MYAATLATLPHPALLYNISVQLDGDIEVSDSGLVKSEAIDSSRARKPSGNLWGGVQVLHLVERLGS